MQHIVSSRRSALPSLVLCAALVASACSDAVGPDASSADVADAAFARRKKPSPSPSPAPEPSNLIAGLTLYVSPSSKAKLQADAWRSSRPEDALQMDKIAAQPQAKWFGNWNVDVRADADRFVAAATATNAAAALVAYNIPLRDCGGYSSGGSNTPQGYRDWITNLASGIGARRAVVILEPDTLAGMSCLSTADRQTCTELLKFAVQTLKALGATSVYIDAGHSHWHSASTIASRLNSAGVSLANGFALNVSNFYYASEQVVYGNAVSALVGGKHYVIDASRSGLGSAGDSLWCNPEGRALGERPTAATGTALADAYLWVKVPGESDGACNGAPKSGTWMPEYALGLAQRASY